MGLPARAVTTRRRHTEAGLRKPDEKEGDGPVIRSNYFDLAMIMGTGFPPFRGGLLRYADSLGLPHVVARLEALAASAGPRYKPNEPLRRVAAGNGTFYQTWSR